jgi:MEDS: MEthanogen/methylotroph, DcmR Sensory domain
MASMESAGRRWQPGDHLCMSLSDPARQGRTLVGLVKDALRHNSKVVVFGENPLSNTLSEWLVAHTGSASKAMERGQLSFVASWASYAPDGEFDPRRRLAEFDRMVANAMREGYGALAVIADLTWVGRRGPDGRTMARYEELCNTRYLGGNLMSVCCYDPGRLSRSVWQEISSAHLSILDPEAPDVVDRRPAGTGTGPDAGPGTGPDAGPEADADAGPDACAAMTRLRARRTSDPVGVRLVGEADLTNRGALPHLLVGTVDIPEPVVIDLSGMRFADANALGQVLRVAVARAGRPTTVIARRQPTRLLEMLGAASVAGLTVAVG